MRNNLLKKFASAAFAAGVALQINAATLTFSYNSADLTATVTGWTDTEPSGELRIPLQSTNPADGKKYNVTAVNPGVFNNLEKVTTVFIRKNIQKIGTCTGNSTSYGARGIDNFLNCPNIQFIEVEEGNKYFKNTGIGMLTSYDGTILYHVPSDVDVSNGRVNLSASITSIRPCAFSGNHTIKTLSLPKNLVSINPNPGFNHMTALEKFEVDAASTQYTIVNNCLFNNSTGDVVSLPPLYSGSSYAIPAKATGIDDFAFANCLNVKSVTFGENVKTIGDGAFAGSGLLDVTIPASVNLRDYGDRAFEGCPNLTSITINSAYIPDHFARNSKALKSITLNKSLVAVGACAFKDCTALKDFEFKPNVIYGDSAFAHTGFENITFKKGHYEKGISSPKALFFNCKNLNTIDMSQVTAANDGDPDFDFYDGFASYCTSLETMIFPASFRSSGTPFNNCNVIKKIVLGNFIAESPIFILSGYQEFNPDVYVAAHFHAENAVVNADERGIDRLFSTINGARLAANIYMDYFDPVASKYDGALTSDPHYAIPGCTYYIPGSTANNYSLAPKAIEMFDISLYKNYNGNGNIKISSPIEGLTPVCCVINAGEDGDGNHVTIAFNDEICATSTPFNHIETVQVRYTVNGVDMRTTYPASALNNQSSSAIDAEIPSDCPFTVFTAAGIPVLHGTGKPDTSLLVPGIYIISAGATTSKIYIR